ncbi:MAG: exosortase system-associated protein, TIGR04073 family [Methylomonas sp.]|jgi:putative exosortase-associated protein (TIGR04073 family)
MKKICASITAAALILLANPDVQADTALQKLSRGMADIVLGVLEVPAKLNKETEAHGGPLGFPLGLFEGVGMMAGRELVGVYEFVTAPFPIPSNYQSVLEPEYPWGYF